MTEKSIAKLTFSIGLAFLASLYVVDLGFGGWDYPLSDQAGYGLNTAARAYWGIGGIALMTNLFLMWRDMYRKGKWAWFVTTIFVFFFSALSYYFIEYRKQNTQDI
ncbi:hypothetical protein [Marinimicrobium agarilyticum]|uniref:hypothetical protein n=1 Tax=Marinimicrobium agarilyticum TaxID=306546 RepID=UPI000482B6E0|nr:hypothetical protein [Marinimicrobium agarilyticum]